MTHFLYTSAAISETCANAEVCQMTLGCKGVVVLSRADILADYVSRSTL